MIACLPRRTMICYSTTNTSSATDVTYADDTTCPTVYVASDDGWQEIAADAFVCVVMEVKEPAQKPDEPNTGRRVPVCCERPHRRLATVNRAVRNRRPRQAASTYG